MRSPHECPPPAATALNGPSGLSAGSPSCAGSSPALVVGSIRAVAALASGMSVCSACVIVTPPSGMSVCSACVVVVLPSGVGSPPGVSDRSLSGVVARSGCVVVSPAGAGPSSAPAVRSDRLVAGLPASSGAGTPPGSSTLSAARVVGEAACSAGVATPSACVPAGGVAPSSRALHAAPAMSASRTPAVGIQLRVDARPVGVANRRHGEAPGAVGLDAIDATASANRMYPRIDQYCGNFLTRNCSGPALVAQ